ncbi:MAG: tripartite tricarboxylate transporter TctB family protein [Planctomycetes bacterium]|nr:tripartite tricarboxylate transporter TctB family protein [Planctomycetota bacterium]
MTTKCADRVGSGLMLVLVAVMWSQRNYMTPFGGIFPDRIMSILALLALLLFVRSFRSSPTIDNERKDPRNWLDLTVVGLLLLGWVLSLSTLGFFVTGVLGFSGISIFLARGKLNMKVIARSIGYALIMTYGLILIFAKLLLVPLPVGTLFE